MNKINILALALLGSLCACQSQPIIPTTKDITITRTQPSDKCENLGKLEGKTMYAKGSKEEALEDLKEQAANKGATHIQVHQFSNMGTSVTGTLFRCP